MVWCHPSRRSRAPSRTGCIFTRRREQITCTFLITLLATFSLCSRSSLQAVKNSMIKTCKCHGVSGSCTTKTCWRTLPAFQAIGTQLMKRYAHARQVITSAGKRYRHLAHTARYYVDANSAASAMSLLLSKQSKSVHTRSDEPLRAQTLQPRPRELVFLDQSPNYCDANAVAGTLGTKGRLCNKTADAVDSCSTLCCGRGNFTRNYLHGSHVNEFLIPP